MQDRLTEIALDVAAYLIAGVCQWNGSCSVSSGENEGQNSKRYLDPGACSELATTQLLF